MYRLAINNVEHKSVVIYKYEFKNLLGSIPEGEFIPQHNDICVEIEHAGDCFNYYVALREEEDQLKVVGKFGAYSFGKSIGIFEGCQLLRDINTNHLSIEDLVKISKELKDEKK